MTGESEAEARLLLEEGAARMGAHLSGETPRLFMDYMSLLLEWNEKMNLTAITDPRDVVIKHFMDSLTVLPALPETVGITVMDVGAGAGLPGLALALARRDLRVTLLDSLGKRVDFLERAAQALGLEGVRCVHARAEDAGRDPAHRQAYDVCVARAVANLTALAEYCLPFVKPGGKFISMKGPLAGTRLMEEINDAKPMIALLGGEVSAVSPALNPLADACHTLVTVRKFTETPAKYPRKPGKIRKSPLKR